MRAPAAGHTDQMREQHVQVGLQPIANPLPLTFAGLLVASAVVSAGQLGWIPPSERATLGWTLVAIPIPLQLIASWWGFVGRSATAATGSGILAAVWLASGLDVIHAHSATVPSHVLGVLLIASAGALFVPTLANLRNGSLLTAAVLGAAAVRFVVGGVAGVAHSVGWAHASGWAGIGVAVVALYGALAFELESTAQETIVPTFRTGQSAEGLRAPFERQIAEMEHEAGVRRSL